MGLRLVLFFVLAARAALPALAQEPEGFYLSAGLGANVAPGMDFFGEDNDHSQGSGCDEFINPNAARYDFCGLENRGDSWRNEFGGAEGVLAGAALGYRLRGRFRLEVEYFYRDSKYAQTAPVLGGGGSVEDKLAAELQRAEHRVDRIASHNLFGNVYFDLVNSGRLTPYVGVGLGVALTDMGFGALWARNPDPAYITSVEGKFSAADTEAIQVALAGTTTSVQTGLGDTLVGYQLLFGVDYALSESISWDLKLRLVDFDGFQDGGPYDRMRSHESNLRVDGSAPVTYRQSTDDTGMIGLNANLTYRF